MAHRERKALTKFGAWLRQYRKNRVLSQGDLARACDITSDQLSQWELGRIHPTDPSLRKLASGTGIAFEELQSLRDQSRSEYSVVAPNAEKRSWGYPTTFRMSLQHHKWLTVRAEAENVSMAKLINDSIELLFRTEKKRVKREAREAALRAGHSIEEARKLARKAAREYAQAVASESEFDIAQQIYRKGRGEATSSSVTTEPDTSEATSGDWEEFGVSPDEVEMQHDYEMVSAP